MKIVLPNNEINRRTNLNEIAIAIAKTKEKAGHHEKDDTLLKSLSTAGIAVMWGVAAMVGVWSILALCGILLSVSPLELIKSFFSAISGM